LHFARYVAELCVLCLNEDTIIIIIK